MDYQHGQRAEDFDRAVTFTGNWREFLPIAATNVLLIIVTLGIYRFWAAARDRRYLWSRTRVIDDTLEWTGTGKEMFFGFLMVIAALIPFFLFVQFALPSLLARGHEAAAFALAIGLYFGLFWLIGLASFRATRYRLTRTWWHGIRGGSNESGAAYANQYVGRYTLTFFTSFLLFPWATTKLWNARWNGMSFGPHRFEAFLSSEGLWRRWIFIYAVAFGSFFIGMAAIMGAITSGNAGNHTLGVGLLIAMMVLVIYIAIPLATLHWWAKFYRKAAASLCLGELRFGFEARTRDWLFLFLGNVGLAIVTLGLGMAFWSYRNWSFMVRHTRLYGNVDLDSLTQSRTAAPKESEGFADAFDMGAI